MKKLFSFVVLAAVMLCTSVAAKAETYKVDFSETTGGEMPAGWLNLDDGNVWINGMGYLYFYFPATGSHPVITPKLTMTAGDTFTVYAAPSVAGYASYTANVKVYVSPDRATWTQVGEIKPYTEASPEDMTWDTNAGTTPTEFVFSGFPAGDYYVGFWAQGTNLKSVEGFTLAQVDYDAMITAFATPKAAIVNNKLATSVSVKNLLNSATQFDATLYADGEAVHEITNNQLAANATETVNLDFVPHLEGNVELKVELKFSESYKLETSVVTVPCGPETSDVESHVGGYGEYSATGQIVILSSRANSYTESIWYASEIAVPSGKQITKIVFPHWSNTYSDFTATMRVYLQNTTATLVGDAPESKDNMTKVYEGLRTYTKVGTSAELVDFVIELDTPFEYTGGNLRLAVESVNSSATYRNVYFNYYTAESGRTGTKYASSEEALATASFNHSSTYMPCGSLFYHIDAPKVTVNVVNESGDPVADAVVTLYNEEKDVLYTATSNAEGVATLDVYQSLSYEVTVEADEYKPYESTLEVAGADVTLPVTLESTGTGVNAIAVAPASRAHKVMVNGVVYVEKDGKLYNMQGSRVK